MTPQSSEKKSKRIRNPKVAIIRVLIAVPNRFTRELITKMFNEHPRFKVVGIVARLEDTLDLISRVEVDVVLLHAAHGDGTNNGLWLLPKLKLFHPKLRVVISADISEASVVLPAFRGGARGVFAFAESSIDSLLKCVESVHEGNIWASTPHIEYMIEELIQTPRMNVCDAVGANLLSKRERDVLRLVAEGMTNKEIADHLNLSEHTIKNHMFRIFERVGVSSRTELVLFAVSRGKEQIAELVSGLTSESSLNLHDGALSNGLAGHSKSA